jgi:NAD(P)-dependent dehydrogenase (short-subunit alcohol dehydrogenase family)
MLRGTVALVTGASRGIGQATAIELARRGAHVVITARTQGGLEETDDAIQALGGACTLLPQDLADGDAIDAWGPSLHERFGRLDILVHAAGTLGKLTPAGHIMTKDWNAVMAVNLAAAWRLIRTTDPLLRAAPSGRAVFLTDARAAQPWAYWGLYGASKAGMEYLVRSWAHEMETTAMRINLFSPGPVATRLRAAAMPGEDQTALARPSDVAPAIAGLCLPSETRTGQIISA